MTSYEELATRAGERHPDRLIEPDRRIEPDRLIEHDRLMATAAAAR